MHSLPNELQYNNDLYLGLTNKNINTFFFFFFTISTCQDHYARTTNKYEQ